MRLRPTPFVVSALLGLAACSTTSSEASNDSPPQPLPTIDVSSDSGPVADDAPAEASDEVEVESIVMIGDSITVGATEELDGRLDGLGFDDVSIVAQEGKRMNATSGDNTGGSEISTFIAENVDSPPEETLWIVALGTNDIGSHEDTALIDAEVEQVLAPIPSESPLIWINTYVRQKPDGTTDVNDAIERVLAERGNATIGDWSSIAPDDGVMSGDGIHPSDEGSVVFADLVTRTVADFVTAGA